MESLDAWRDRMIAGLLSAQQDDGSFGGHPYRRWTGAHWRLVSLVELGIPAGHRDAVRAVEGVLRWIAGPSPARVVAGRERRHASMEGNALFVCSRLGFADDARVRSLVERLLRAQWPDGGWYCDQRPAATHSSFHETVTPIRGLAAYHAATAARGCLQSQSRAGVPHPASSAGRPSWRGGQPGGTRPGARRWRQRHRPTRASGRPPALSKRIRPAASPGGKPGRSATACGGARSRPRPSRPRAPAAAPR